MDSNFIDAHVHVWDLPSARYPYDPGYIGEPAKPARFPPEHLLAIARPVGVRKIVLVEMSFYGSDCRYMLDAMRHFPGVFSGIGIVDSRSPSMDKEMGDLASQGVKGLRITQEKGNTHWLQTSEMRSLWRSATGHDLAVCCLVNPDGLSSVDAMCREFPSTKVVIDHLGRIGIDGTIHQKDVDALTALARHERVQVKVSAFYALGKKQAPFTDLIPLVHELYRAYGPRRLMWASDSPFQVQPPYTYAESLDFVSTLPFLQPEDKEWMLRRTAETLFF